MQGFDAVVLAGGGGRRLGGVDKAALPHRGATLLDHVLSACGDADRRVVVGPPRRLPPDVLQVREEPPGSGPAAALAAALPLLSGPVVVLLAADLPLLTRAAVAALRTALAGHDVVLAVDRDGRDQYLCGAWRRAALRPGAHRVRDLLGGLDVHRLELPGEPWRDVDTPGDLARWTSP